jgi:hypothetical protein
MTAPRQAIEQVYVAFADVLKPRAIEGCQCCTDGKEIDTLLATPLRKLSSDELRSYAFSAFLTVGSTADYLYFLPRILELHMIDAAGMFDVEVTGRAIRACEPDSWLQARKDAVRRLFSAVIADLIESGHHDELDSWLCATARIGFEVAPLLAQIEKAPAVVLKYFELNAESLRRQERLSNPFWELPSAGHDEIVRWLTSERIRRIPFEAYGYSA